MDTPVTARAALLQALVQGEGYGLDLIARVEQLTGGAIKLGQGSIYPALNDLEEEGLLKSWEGEPRQGKPRQYYALTTRGLRAATEHRMAVMGLFGISHRQGTR